MDQKLTFQQAEQQDTSSVVHVMNPLIGYALLIAGVVVMFMSVYQIYQVYTHKAEPIELFHFEGIKIDPTAFAPKLMDNPQLQELQKKFNIQLNQPATSTEPVSQIEIFPAKMINDTANLSAYFFLMGFILNFGYKIASLGIKLVRPVYVRA